MTLKNVERFEEALTCRFKIGMSNLTNFDPRTWISKMCSLMGCLWTKYIIFELKNYRGVMFDGTENWCKIWRKNDLCFPKWHEQFGNFPPEPSKVLKLGLWWDTFIQSRICMRLKFTGELCVLAMWSNAKLKRNKLISSKLTCVVWRILTRALKNLWKLHFNGLLLTKFIMLELEKYRGVMSDSTENWYEIWRKLTCAFKFWQAEN